MWKDKLDFVKPTKKQKDKLNRIFNRYIKDNNEYLENINNFIEIIESGCFLSRLKLLKKSGIKEKRRLDECVFIFGIEAGLDKRRLNLAKKRIYNREVSLDYRVRWWKSFKKVLGV